MANKREFKKSVEAVGSSLVQQMMMAYETAAEKERDTIQEAITKTIAAIGAAQANADVTFDKGVTAFENLKEYSKAKKAFYKQLFVKINDDFAKELDEALKLFNSVVATSKEAKTEA